MSRLGLYGGTFDPVHHGHLIGAQDALEQCRLHHLFFIPCAHSPHKANDPGAAAALRLRLLRAAVRGQKKFSISDCEIQRGAPSYTIDTVELFRRRFPAAALFWLIGADQIERLTAWHRYAELRRLVTFLVLDRPGASALRRRAGLICLPRPRPVAISSTEIRARLKKNLSIHHLVPSVVTRLITQHRLYGPAS